MPECIRCGIPLPENAVYCHMCGKKQQAQPRKRKKRSHANGLGTVYKRGRSWYCERTFGYELVDGKARRVYARKGGFKTSGEATAYLPQLEPRHVIVNPEITFKALYEQWLPGHEEKVSHSTINCYKAAFKYFEPIYYVRFSALKTASLQQCLDNCGQGKRTRQNMKALGTLLYKYAMQNDVVSKDYASFLEVSGATEAPREAFTTQQVAQMFSQLEAVPDLRYVIVLCYTGFRLGEFLSLKVTDYHEESLPNGESIGYLIGGSKTEAGRNRAVTISPAIAPIVAAFRNGRSDGYLFSPNGKKLQDGFFREKIYYSALAAAGLPRYVPHCCRHTFYTLMKNTDAPLADKMALAGHANAKMAVHYTHADLQSRAHVTDQLSRPTG